MLFTSFSLPSRLAGPALRWAGAMCTTLALVACGGGGSSSGPAATQEVTRLDDTACAYALHPSVALGRDVRCGVLVAPQDRREPAGPVVRIPYVVFKSPQVSTLPPVVYLTGGPGQTWTQEVPQVAAGQSPGFLGGVKLARDEVLIEQRGSQATMPALNQCKAPRWVSSDYADGREVLRQLLTDLSACASQVLAAGIKITGFNTDELAADVADLTRLLGYDKVVLNGVSYGTMWASAVMRDHPAQVDSAILDSVVQQAQPTLASQWVGWEAALKAASDACVALGQCALADADLVTRAQTLVQALDTKPLTWSAGPGGRFTSGVFFSTVTPLLAFAPSALPDFFALAETLVGSGASLDALPQEVKQSLLEISAIARVDDSLPQYLSIVCADNASVTPSQIDAQLATIRPAFRAYARAQADEGYQVCKSWPARRDLPASSFAPVRSNIPVLILTGATDPLTPRAWAEQAALTLPAATVVRFPLRGHSLQSGSGSCVSGIVAAFLQRQSLNPACASGDQGL